MTRINGASRTASYFLGLGERTTGEFSLVENSFQFINQYAWTLLLLFERYFGNLGCLSDMSGTISRLTLDILNTTTWSSSV